MIAMFKKVLSWIKRVAVTVRSLLRKIILAVQLFKIIKLKQKVVFRDRFGFRFWIDNIESLKFSWSTNAVGDSGGVVSYLMKNIRKGNICVDIGTHQAGISVPLWARSGKEGRVVSVEADASKIDRIKQNLRLNGFSDEYVVSNAISDKREQRKFRIYPDSPGWNTFGNPSFAKKYESSETQVECITGNDLFSTYNLDFVHLVKIDVEGAEPLVLNGLIEKFRACKIEQCIFEVNPLMLPGLGFATDQLKEFWSNLPYDLYRINDDRSLREVPSNWSTVGVWDCVAILNPLAKQALGNLPDLPQRHEELRLDLGCGPNKRSGFIGVDLHDAADLRWDLRWGLPFPDASVSMIRSDHFFEHLEIENVVALLRECHRVLKPGGLLDYSVPHIDPYLDAYLSRDYEFLAEKIYDVPPGQEMLYNTCFDRIMWLLYRNGEHRSLFDKESIIDKVKLAGFAQVRARECNPETDMNIRFSSVYIEAIK